MKALKILLILAGVIIGVNLLVTGVNIIQKGGSYKGQSPSEILGVDPAQAKADDVLRLSKAQFMQLFYALPAPELGEINGEYAALNHPGGIMAAAVGVYTDHFFGPGKWSGKAFRPLDKNSGEGYNIFVTAGGYGKKEVIRTRRIVTGIGKSEYDDKNSFKLNYGPHNGGIVHSMRDELRRLNDSIYIGLGCMALGGGAVNPSLFILTGKPEPWVGPDK